MLRHPLLVPFSREHHQFLILAQVLRNDVPDYRGMPTTPAGKREYALDQYAQLVAPHFEQEESWLFPVAQQGGLQLRDMVRQLQEEHRQIRARFELLPEVAEADLSQQLHDLALLISTHVRFEERLFFETLQEANVLSMDEETSD